MPHESDILRAYAEVLHAQIATYEEELLQKRLVLELIEDRLAACQFDSCPHSKIQTSMDGEKSCLYFNKVSKRCCYNEVLI